MGIDIQQTRFSTSDHARFRDRLLNNLEDLRQLLSRPGFGIGPQSIGAELEMYLVDDNGHPVPCNEAILARSGDPQLTLELNRYNLEYNLTPREISNHPFRMMEAEIRHQISILGTLAEQEGAKIANIGILPTLTKADFGVEFLTDRKRYHALVEQLIDRRGSLFKIDINGQEPLKLDMHDITLEGANTSFQVHYRTDPADYVDTYNAFQLVTPLVVAVAANSPTLFGHRLWHETRIPLFKQSIDTRNGHRYGWHEPSRVHFGHGWVRQTPFELFAEVARLYEPLLPVCSDQSPKDVPELAELRLLQSTVWLWNRPIYDDAEGGMLRIEARALPSGPTAVDMVANSALLIGLAEGLRPSLEELLPALPFQMADYNFYRAAQHGLDARLVWPEARQSGCRERPVLDILRELLPLASDGLSRIGVNSTEADYYLDIVAQRLNSRQTGASWQLDMFQKFSQGQNSETASRQLLARYMALSAENAPVGSWKT